LIDVDGLAEALAWELEELEELEELVV